MTGSLWRKFLTRPIWWWEKHRPYPVRNRVFGFRPVPTEMDTAKLLVVLAIPATINDAAWCAWSILRQIQPLELNFIIDGEIPDGLRQKLNRLFPNARIAQARDLLDSLPGENRNLLKLAAYHPLGRKLGAVLGLQQNRDIVFSDADVLAFSPLPEIRQFIADDNSPGLYLQDLACVQMDPRIGERARQLGVPYAATINTGFLCVRRSSLDLRLAEKLLEGSEPFTSWFVETGVLAVLMERATARPLAKDRYRVSTQRQFYFEPDENYGAIALRHFITPVRQLMYSRGMPALLVQRGPDAVLAAADASHRRGKSR